MNCWSHGLCSKPQNTLMMTCDPPCPPNDLIKMLDTWHESMKKRNMTPYCFFDGHKHPMKSKTHKQSANTRAKAEEALQLFYEYGKDKSVELEEVDHVKSMKNPKNIAVPDNKMISLVIEWLNKNNVNCMCARFEAKWQCVFFEKKGIVDAVTSIDGDCAMLGTNKVLCEVNFNNCLFKLRDKSAETNNVTDDPLLARDEEKWSFVRAVLGCNHLKRI